MTATLTGAACAVLQAADPAAKVSLTARFAAKWRDGALSTIGRACPPERPARPPRPVLLPPRDMPKRRAAGSAAARIALLHALAHIELNAIDLAWDMIARFGPVAPGSDFFADWVRVADEEALHHRLLSERLLRLGAAYGDLPAHDGLWDAARATADDLLARLAIVPLVLEARGLDVTPGMIARLDRAGDDESAGILQRIYDDEIGHVAIGRRWFESVCAARGLPASATWRQLVRTRFRGMLKPPFNRPARDAAGFPPAYYEAFCPALSSEA